MNNGTTTAEVKCDLHQFERNRYFYGKLLSVRDFEVEQRYSREHRYLHNQSLHGKGVVCGLKVEKSDEAKIVVKPGLALDCCGREIVVARDHQVDLKSADFQLALETALSNNRPVYLCLKYDECSREPAPVTANVSTCEEVCDYSRIQENFVFDFLTGLPAPAPSTACETWMNLTSVVSEIREGAQKIAEIERTAPRYVRPGEVFEVHRRIKPLASNKTIRVTDSLPPGFGRKDGLLAMEVVKTLEGRAVHSAYLVEVADSATTAAYQIAGQETQPSVVSLNASSVEVISSAQSVEAKIQEVLFEQQFAACPHCANDPNGSCVVLAKITLQPQGSSFAIGVVDPINFSDADQRLYRQLVYGAPLLVELLECARNWWLKQPFTPGFQTVTGTVRFEDLGPGERRTSAPAISHGFGAIPVNINLAVETDASVNEYIMGELNPAYFEIKDEAPPAFAALVKNDGTFKIILTNQTQEQKDYTIRWWATPAIEL